MADHFQLADTAAHFILTRTPLRPKIGLILGSGLGAFADSLDNRSVIDYHDIPNWPQSTAVGHAGMPSCRIRRCSRSR